MNDGPLPTRCPSIRLILEAVADEFRVTMLDLQSARRDRLIARPRQVAMYLARHMTLMSVPAIGNHIGHRDHTTVTHAVGRITALMDGDKAFASRVHLLMDALAFATDVAPT